MASTPSRPERFVIVEEPFYSAWGTRYPLRGESPVPGIGDVVTTDLSDHDGIDEDGDRAVLFDGEAFDIADAVLVSIDALIKSPEDRANPLADWERELLSWDGPFHEVTLRQAVIRPDKLADLLKSHGMSAQTVETLTALAVLRSVS